MPPTSDMIDDATDVLPQLRLENFDATPDTVRPFGTTTLTWRVSGPSGPLVLLRGRGWELPVARQGSRDVTPGDQTTDFQLRALFHTVYRFLGSRRIEVDGSDCTVTAEPESDVQQEIRQEIDRTYGGAGQEREIRGITVTVKKRDDPDVELDATGLRIRASFDIEIPDFFDPIATIDALALLSAEGGRPVASFREFSSHIKLPWWVWATAAATGFLGIGITAFVNEVVDRLVRPELQRAVEQSLQNILDAYVTLLGLSGQTLVSLTTAQDRVVFTICPA
jgi:hypothetical protein